MPIDAQADALKSGFRIMSDRYTKPTVSATAPVAPVQPALFDKCDQFFAEEGLFARVKEADLYPYF
jgi:hypothetical protein